MAIRKGLDNNWAHHLDYFTVDLNEEFSALFGGVLEEQTKFVGQCIKEILNLYSGLPNRPRSITIVGHSMGGTIAYALLRNTEVAPLIGTIIALSAPLDKPVVNLDVYINAFYRSINDKFSESRKIRKIGNNTNTCCSEKMHKEEPRNPSPKGFDDKLLISIGGGSRDIIVHSGQSDSIYSDIHAMSTSIPRVWLTTDHLCAVWCLQSVLVINRFLFNTIKTVKGRNAYGKGHQFIDEKEEKLSTAIHHLRKVKIDKRSMEVTLISENKLGNWIEDSRRVFSHQFRNGINETRFQMIRLIDSPQYQILNVEAINFSDKDWVFGCAALDVLETMRYW